MLAHQSPGTALVVSSALAEVRAHRAAIQLQQAIADVLNIASVSGLAISKLVACEFGFCNWPGDASQNHVLVVVLRVRVGLRWRCWPAASASGHILPAPRFYQSIA